PRVRAAKAIACQDGVGAGERRLLREHFTGAEPTLGAAEANAGYAQFVVAAGAGPACKRASGAGLSSGKIVGDAGASHARCQVVEQELASQADGFAVTRRCRAVEHAVRPAVAKRSHQRVIVALMAVAQVADESPGFEG